MTDYGTRCDRHVGEVFSPRCVDCEAETRQNHIAGAGNMIPRVGYIPGTSCPLHPFYPMPCARCARDKTEPTTPEGAHHG